MATAPEVSQGKTTFLEGFLPGHRDAGLEAVTSAWNAAGNTGTISESLFGKVRARLGMTGKRGPRARAGASASRATVRPAVKGKAKASPKADESGSPRLGRKDSTDPGKTPFVEEMLRREPRSNVKAINRAWSAAGNPGKISDSVIYKAKRDLGATRASTLAAPAQPSTSSPTRGPKARPSSPTTSSKPVGGSTSSHRESALDRVEDGIDDLIFELKRLGGLDEAVEAMRKVRRLVVRSHEG